MKTAIVGVPASGKSTLFRLLTGVAEPPPGTRPAPRVGIARVPDPRLQTLAGFFQPKKTTPATIEYVDLPGVTKGSGAALVDLPALRGIDALLHVVRAFESESVPHPDGSLDPRFRRLGMSLALRMAMQVEPGVDGVAAGRDALLRTAVKLGERRRDMDRSESQRF